MSVDGHDFPKVLYEGMEVPEAWSYNQTELPHLQRDLEALFPKAVAAPDAGDRDPPARDLLGERWADETSEAHHTPPLPRSPGGAGEAGERAAPGSAQENYRAEPFSPSLREETFSRELFTFDHNCDTPLELWVGQIPLAIQSEGESESPESFSYTGGAQPHVHPEPLRVCSCDGVFRKAEIRALNPPACCM